MGEGLSHKQVYPQEDYCSMTESCQQAFKCVPSMYSLPFLKETIAGFDGDILLSLEQRGRCPLYCLWPTLQKRKSLLQASVYD